MKRRVNTTLMFWYFWEGCLRGTPTKGGIRPDYRRGAIILDELHTSPVVAVGEGWVKTETGTTYKLKGQPRQDAYKRGLEIGGDYLDLYRKAMGEIPGDEVQPGTLGLYYKAIRRSVGCYVETDKPVPRGTYGKGRDVLVREYSWAIPSYSALKSIVEFAPKIVELGAGTGFWAKCLEETGAQVHAYDANPPHTGTNSYQHKRQWFDVKQGNIGAVQQHGPDWALFLCWPPYQTDLELNAYRAFKGDKIIYVGEGLGGCTGTTSAKDYRSEHFELVKHIRIPSYDMIYDHVELWQRK